MPGSVGAGYGGGRASVATSAPNDHGLKPLRPPGPFDHIPKKKVDIPREPVPNFSFDSSPENMNLELFHQNQLHWLNDQAMARIIREEKARDFVDTSVGDLKTSIDELTRWLERIDKEGNEWKSRYENQQEFNNSAGLQILKLTDAIENLKLQIANNEPPLTKFDDFSDVKWKKLLKHEERLRQKLAEDIRDIEWRLEQEAKAYYKVNRARNDFHQELSVLNHYESKELEVLQQQKNKQQDEWRTRQPANKRQILEEFGANRPRGPPPASRDSSSDRGGGGKMVPERSMNPSARYTRSRGRFTPRDSGNGSISRSTARTSDRSAERAATDYSQGKPSLTGSRVHLNRKTEDPVEALFATSKSNVPAGYGFEPRESRIGKENRKSALKTERTTASRFSSNKVSFDENQQTNRSQPVSRRTTKSMATSKGYESEQNGYLPNSRATSGRTLPPVERRGSGTSGGGGGGGFGGPNGQKPRKMPNTNGVQLTPKQQAELDKMLQKPAKFRAY